MLVQGVAAGALLAVQVAGLPSGSGDELTERALVEPLAGVAPPARGTTSSIPPIMTPAYRMRVTDRPACNPTIVPNAFGAIQNFAAATSLCRSMLAPSTETQTITTTISPGDTWAEYYAEADAYSAPTPTFNIVHEAPARAREACSCLIGPSIPPLTVTETVTSTTTPRATGLSRQEQYQIALRMQKDNGALPVPTLDPRYGKPVRHQRH